MSITTLRSGREYRVLISSNQSFTVTVAKSCPTIRGWLEAVKRYHSRRLRNGELVVGISVQWRKDSPANVLQICIGKQVLLVQLGFFYKLPRILRSFLVQRAVSYYGIGVGRFREKLAGCHHSPVKTKYVVDLRDTLVDDEQKAMTGASLSRLLAIGGIKGTNAEQLLLSLEDASIVSSDWSRCDLLPGQLLHSSLKAIIAFKLGLICQGQAAATV